MKRIVQRRKVPILAEALRSADWRAERIHSTRMRGVSIMALDLGSRRIGIAISDSGVLATPHSVIRNEGDTIETIAELGRTLDVEIYVVGIAKRPSGAGEGKFRKFADGLKERTKRPVILWDETLSTREALSALRESGRARRKAQSQIDMHAATVILQSFLNHQSRGTP